MDKAELLDLIEKDVDVRAALVGMVGADMKTVVAAAVREVRQQLMHGALRQVLR
jgi:hypothetical protein